MTDAELEQEYPWIPWREPIPIATPSASGLGCRLCIGVNGIKAGDVSTLPQTPEEFARHMVEAHTQ